MSANLEVQDSLLAPPAQPPVPRRRRRSPVREILETLLLTAILWSVSQVALQNFRVDGHSMDPTLHNGEYIIVDKVSYHVHQPNRGDIIVFVAPPDPTRDYIKRVIGVPGDTVKVSKGIVYVNGVALAEPYEAQPPQYELPPTTVPPHDLFVLGDNRNESYDSHLWGFVPFVNVIGRATLAYWPLPDVAVFSQPSYAAVPTTH